MPIEIKELHIRVALTAGAGQAPVTTGAASATGGTGVDKDAVVAEAVEQVLEILQAKKDR